LHDLADELGVSLPDAAVQLSLRDPRIDTTVVGLSKPERISAMLSWLETDIGDEFWDRAELLMPHRQLWLDAGQQPAFSVQTLVSNDD